MNVINSLINKGPREDESWISTADMMAGLMMIFLFIAIVYIQNVGQYVDAISDVQERLCKELKDEFKDVEKKWMMSICEDGLVIKFKNESVFKKGESQISDNFKKILNDFYPRFMDIIWANKENISELRIEGHTSSEAIIDSKLESYIFNTRLSQNRSRSVMDYALKLDKIISNYEYLDWSYKNLTAHGMSSSDLIFYDNQAEDKTSSRRVEFRLKTNAQDNLIDIVRQLNAN